MGPERLIVAPHLDHAEEKNSSDGDKTYLVLGGMRKVLGTSPPALGDEG